MSSSVEKRAIAERAVAERAALVQAALARAAALQRAAVLKGAGAGPALAEGAALVKAALARAAALKQANARTAGDVAADAAVLGTADELASAQADASTQEGQKLEDARAQATAAPAACWCPVRVRGPPLYQPWTGGIPRQTPYMG